MKRNIWLQIPITKTEKILTAEEINQKRKRNMFLIIANVLFYVVLLMLLSLTACSSRGFIHPKDAEEIDALSNVEVAVCQTKCWQFAHSVVRSKTIFDLYSKTQVDNFLGEVQGCVVDCYRPKTGWDEATAYMNRKAFEKPADSQ